MIARIFDILVVVAAAPVVIPAVIVAAILVRLETPGAAIFAQQRVGRDAREFRCYKVRTMFQGTPNAASHLVSKARVTHVGRILRATKIDELPQFWNVLLGEMALVGPRPCLPNQTELVEERRERGVYGVRPGITGLAQINQVDMSNPEKLARLDAEWIKTRTFLGDIKILIKTAIGKGSGDRTNCACK